MRLDRPGLLLFFYLQDVWIFAILKGTEAWDLEGFEVTISAFWQMHWENRDLPERLNHLAKGTLLVSNRLPYPGFLSSNPLIFSLQVSS